MDESPIAKLVEHATAAHAAVIAQREAARQVAEQSRQEILPLLQAQGQADATAP